MSTAQIALLGLIAGGTIFIGLPVGRMRALSGRTRVVLNGLAIGILVFLFFDVIEHAFEPVEDAAKDSAVGHALGYGLILVVGLSVGLMSLVYFDRWMRHRNEALSKGPGAAAVDDVGVHTPAVKQALALSMMIAIGIGLHNFGEGLAIGNSAAGGEIALATMLVIGFALHNATEGFGIVAPLAAAGVHPTWGRLAVLGVIGGGPTFVGTLIGQHFVSTVTSILFLSLAAGSILYVVIELLAVIRRAGYREAAMWALLIGLFAGLATDAIVGAAGG